MHQLQHFANKLQTVKFAMKSTTKAKKIAVPLIIGGAYLGFAGYVYKNENKMGKCDLLKKSIAGSIGIAVTELFLFPLDTVNMKLKADRTGKSFFKMVRSIYQKEGLMGYCKGGQPLFYYTSFGGILYFYFYELFRKKFDDCNAAGLSEMILLITTHPLEYIKIRMQTSLSKSPQFTEELNKMKECVKPTGSSTMDLKKIYRGFIPNMATSMGFIFSQYGCYHYSRAFLKKTSMKDKDNSSILLCSALSGMVASVWTNGFETMAVMMQSNSNHAAMPKLSMSMFTRGLCTRISYYVIMSIVEFFLVEHIYKLYGVKFCKEA
jgi:hypothetical protein